MPFFDWEQIVNVLGSYYSYTTQRAKSALINLRQKEAKTRLNADLCVRVLHMETPTHLLNYSWAILCFLNNAWDKQRRLLTVLLFVCFLFVSFSMESTRALWVLTTDLISTIDQTYTVRTFPLRKGIQESAETWLIQFGSRDAWI